MSDDFAPRTFDRDNDGYKAFVRSPKGERRTQVIIKKANGEIYGFPNSFMYGLRTYAEGNRTILTFQGTGLIVTARMMNFTEEQVERFIDEFGECRILKIEELNRERYDVPESEPYFPRIDCVITGSG